jgi:hypothetical protein
MSQQFYFELTADLPDTFAEDPDVDYMIILRNTNHAPNECDEDEEFDDDIGMHTEGIECVLAQLNIYDREMENIFVGKFDKFFPDLENVKLCLQDNGWIEWTGKPTCDDYYEDDDE